jgi:glucose/arabinose dehydrogenase
MKPILKTCGFLVLFLCGLLLFKGELAYPFQITLAPHTSGLSLPVAITHAGDGSGRLFVIEQQGAVRIIKDGALQAVPFLNITDRVLSGSERGLLGIAFPPGFSTKGYFYVNYTRAPDGATTISRFHVTNNPDIADPNSEETLLTIGQPFANHNGGQIAFSPRDGYLYIGMGDGGSGGDPLNLAQDFNSLLGKMLRIDVESGVTPYAIPSDNPLLNGVRSEIWALGLRNPWRFSFDRLTHDLYMGDVGQSSREEINFQPASSTGGENYGWRILEGSLCFDPPVGCVPPLNYAPPVAEYDHSQGCSVTGGVVYRGIRHPFMQGTYVYGDFCTGRIWRLKRSGAVRQNTLLIDTPFQISAFGEDEAGEVYVADYATGRIYKIIFSDMTVDFDGDGKTDIAIYRAGTGGWFVIPSTGVSPYGEGWGGDLSDIPVPGDYDRDGKTDIAVYRANNGGWYILPSGGGPFGVGWGGDPSDKPVQGDYDGDGKTDLAVYRTSIGAWFIMPSGGAAPYAVAWGGDATDKPAPGDYDGDGKTDIAVYRTGTGAWYVIPSSGASPYGLGWGGEATDKSAPGDYDGDGKTDIAVYRTNTGAWYVIPSSNPSAPYGLGWGSDPSDIPAPGDYDGDGKTDIAVYRGATGAWYVIPSGGGAPYGLGWGGDPNDAPVTMNLNPID